MGTSESVALPFFILLAVPKGQIMHHLSDMSPYQVSHNYQNYMT